MRMFHLTLSPTFSKGDDSHPDYGNLTAEEEEKCQEIRRWIIILCIDRMIWFNAKESISFIK